ncbi:hypothetical protein Tter_0975 [Thermobaculum terrenum ATCC BAA-798]|uniref:Uncharacterized protein n=1 Tax=Thermobaculum terrenum (strain ATCC BAA-798 / CCMEE 7001 / YNP1) TaxID=525904 RepID=D1CG36_THET1|nr:hypothetical protein Tter_0975 [Thermobaculum terrenum ATCC BAA-798]
MPWDDLIRTLVIALLIFVLTLLIARIRESRG